MVNEGKCEPQVITADLVGGWKCGLDIGHVGDHEVRVLNIGGYVGESTRDELAHARRLNKVVTWLEPDRIPVDLEEKH